MFEDNLGWGLVIVFILFALFGGLMVSMIQSTYTQDCQEICDSRGTEMRRVTSFGCLCENGEVVNHSSNRR